MTTVIRSLKTQPFENRFRSASFLKRFCYSLINVHQTPPPPPPPICENGDIMHVTCLLSVSLQSEVANYWPGINNNIIVLRNSLQKHKRKIVHCCHVKELALLLS